MRRSDRGNLVWICRMNGWLVHDTIIIIPAALSVPLLQGAAVVRAPTIFQNFWFCTRISGFNFFQSPIFRLLGFVHFLGRKENRCTVTTPKKRCFLLWEIPNPTSRWIWVFLERTWILSRFQFTGLSSNPFWWKRNNCSVVIQTGSWRRKYACIVRACLLEINAKR